MTKLLNLKIAIIFILSSVITGSLSAQCSGCSTLITIPSTTSYTVSSGQTLCVNSGVNYSGVITLNGGVVCNSGTLTNVTFKSGTFNNYGTYLKTGTTSYTIANNSNLYLNNYAGSTFSINPTVTIKADHYNDSVTIKTYGSNLFKVNTNLTLTKSKLNIRNGIGSSGSSSLGFRIGTGIAGTGALTVGDSSNIFILNDTAGFFNLTGNLTFNARGRRWINNLNQFIVGGMFSFSGTSNSGEMITINNHDTINVNGIACAIATGSVLINNYSGGTIIGGGSIILTKPAGAVSANAVINAGNFTSSLDFIFDAGYVTNTGSIAVTRDISISNSTLTNSNYMNASRSFSIQNALVNNSGSVLTMTDLIIQSTSTVNNTSSITASNDFKITSSVFNNSNTATANHDLIITTSTVTNNTNSLLNAIHDISLQTSSKLDNYATVNASNDLQVNASFFNSSVTANVGRNFIVQTHGSVVNNGTLSVTNNMTLNTGSYNNNNYTTINNNAIITHSASKFVNSSFVNILDTLINNDTISLDLSSFIQTNNYLNNSTGVINGPPTATDTATYAKVIITGFSQNSGYLNERIIFFDQSLVTTSTNVGYGFDQISNPGRIATTILFISKSNGSGNQPVIDCDVVKNTYFIACSSSQQTICAGSSATLNVDFFYTFFAGIPGHLNLENRLISLPTSSYTWTPLGNFVNPNQQTQIVSPTITTQYTISLTYEGCVYTCVVPVTVFTMAIQYTTIPYSYSTSLTFSPTQTGPAGGTYSASPNTMSINPTTGVITASASAYGTYIVYYTLPESMYCYSMHTSTTIVTLESIECHLAIEPNHVKLCDGNQIQLTAFGGIDGYTWTPSTGLSCTNCISPVLTFTSSVTQYTLTSMRDGTLCGETVLYLTEKKDCFDNSIHGCCFSNYGVAIAINDASTHINVYCNLINEVVQLTDTSVKKGNFENKGNVNVKLDWIHNGKNELYTSEEGKSTFFGSDQNIKGNSNTHFNYIKTNGNGTKTIWIDEFANSDLDLTSNELSIQEYNFLMKNKSAIVSRTSGFASESVNGYFSRSMDKVNATPLNGYLFPLGTRASSVAPFRYRPLTMANNSSSQFEEISANFMNASPSLTDQAYFSPAYSNTVTDKSPSVVQINNTFYHKIKNTTPPGILALPSDLLIKSYYLPIDGSYQSIAEWEKDPNQTTDWWGTTPGASGSNITSTVAGTYGQVYAQTSGPQTFNKKPYTLSKGGFYINTEQFGNGEDAIITLSASPTNTGDPVPVGGGLYQPYGVGPNGGNIGDGTPLIITPNPVAGDYVITITPANDCQTPGKIKFTIQQNGNINPTSVLYGIPTSTNYLGQLSEDVYTIDNQNTGLILFDTPKDILANCVNSIVVSTSTNNDFVLNKTLSAENLNIYIPNIGLTLGSLKIKDASMSVIQTSTLTANLNTITIGTPNHSALPEGVYHFEFTVLVGISTETIKGQFIIK